MGHARHLLPHQSSGYPDAKQQLFPTLARQALVIVHRVTIEPTHRSPKRQYYKATLNGEEIVAKSSDPEFSACRAMKAMGLSGRVEFYRPGVTYPGLIIHDLIKSACLRVIESDDGPVLKGWRPFEPKDYLPGQDEGGTGSGEAVIGTEQRSSG